MASFKLSSDGLVVYRIVSQGTVSAATLNPALINGGYTVTTGTGGSVSVTSYNAGFYTSYNAGVTSGAGGAQITAIYNNGSQLASGQYLQWIQVGTDNDPIAGYTASPWLDNANYPADPSKGIIGNPTASSQPFYSCTLDNSLKGPSLPANEIYFYDYSRRAPGDVSVTKPVVTWSADLYPATVRNRAKLAYNGVTGWLEGTGPMPQGIGAVSGLDENLRLQDRVAQKLKALRHLHGALALETIETRPHCRRDFRFVADITGNESGLGEEVLAASA